MSGNPPADLVKAEGITERLQAAGYSIISAEPTYVRRKPLENTIIAFRLTGADGSTTWAYAQWCYEQARAAEIFEKARTLRPRRSPLGPGLAQLEPHTVFFAFPNDARLRQLRWYVDPRKIKRSLDSLTEGTERIRGSRTKVEVLRYKPERRVVARVDLATTERTSSLLVRYSTRRQAVHLHRIAEHLRSCGVASPAPVAQLSGGRVAVDEFIEGIQVRDAVRLRMVTPAILGEAIARFHSTPQPTSVGQRSSSADLGRALSGMSGLSGWNSRLAEPAQETASMLQHCLPAPSGESVLLHGDLHTKNMLVQNDRVAFIDLERVAVGPATTDLGFLIAHAIALGVRQPGWSPEAEAHAYATVDHYQRMRGPLDAQSLRWHIALGLVEQSLLVARHLEPEWQATCVRILEAAQEQLVGHLDPSVAIRK